MAEQQQRRSTNNQSRRTVRILLIITGILGLVLIAVAVYFYAIGDTNNQNTTTSTTTCGCYFLDPAIETECGDTRRTFQFNLNTVPADQNCVAQCSTSELSANLLNSNTDPDLYKVCQVNNITDTSCNAMTIKDKNGLIVTGKTTSDDELTIEAKFDAEYSNHQFMINNQAVDPDVVSADKLTITKILTDLTNYTSIEVVALATNENGEQVTSTICRRLVEIDNSGEKSVSNMDVSTRTLSDGKTKISGIDISVGNLTSEENIELNFSFSTGGTDLTMEEGFTVDTTKGSINIIESALYDASNFREEESFEQLNDITGEVVIAVNVIEENTDLGRVSSTVTFAEETEEPATVTDEDSTKSSFAVNKETTPQCVERVSPNNVSSFTITITNTGESSDTVESILDKLPLGLEYEEGSTKINNVSVEDSEYVTTTTVGSTQEIEWETTNGWTVSSNQTLTISFDALVSGDALTGEVLNEVIVTPEKVPTDPDTLRSQATVTIQQDCDNEDEEIPTLDPSNTNTGVFDTTAGKIMVGLLTLVVGYYIYTNPIGSKISKALLNSGAYQNAEMTTWKIFNPKRYFEEKTVRRLKKDK